MISDLDWGIGFENDVVILPLVISWNEVRTGAFSMSMLYQAIKTEGISVVLCAINRLAIEAIASQMKTGLIASIKFTIPGYWTKIALWVFVQTDAVDST